MGRCLFWFFAIVAMGSIKILKNAYNFFVCHSANYLNLLINFFQILIKEIMKSKTIFQFSAVIFRPPFFYRMQKKQ